jgi:hypothetical protein
MQKMQSPYNSKTMKNKFGSIKGKKGSIGNISIPAHLTSNNVTSNELNISASVNMISGGHH